MLGAPISADSCDQSLRGTVHRHRRIPAREHDRGGAAPRRHPRRRRCRSRLGGPQELQVALPRAGPPRGPGHRGDALRDGRAPALVRGHRARCSSRPEPTCRTPRASSTRCRASAPCRSRSSSRRLPPTASRSACARASQLTRPTSARRSEAEATGAPRAPSSPDPLHVAERKVLEVARRLIDPAG